MAAAPGGTILLGTQMIAYAPGQSLAPRDPANILDSSICVIVVTFHPSNENIENLRSIRQQVGRMIVIDNRSTDEERLSLRNKCSECDIHLVENSENLGIGAALNIGVRWAVGQQCQWVVLFDQDSKPPDGFMTGMLSALLQHPESGRVAIMVPSYWNKQLGLAMGAFYDKPGELEVAMTSGSIIPVRVFEQNGFFDEKLFIDCVDYDYCLKVRRNGWIIAEFPALVLMHEPASYKAFRVNGRKFFATSNYSPIRRYYRTRNLIWLFRRYRKEYCWLCVHQIFINLKDCAKIIAENGRWQKYKAVFRGCVDGLFAGYE